MEAHQLLQLEILMFFFWLFCSKHYFLTIIRTHLIMILAIYISRLKHRQRFVMPSVWFFNCCFLRCWDWNDVWDSGRLILWPKNSHWQKKTPANEGLKWYPYWKDVQKNETFLLKLVFGISPSAWNHQPKVRSQQIQQAEFVLQIEKNILKSHFNIFSFEAKNCKL